VSDLLPATDGLFLGNDSRRWDGSKLINVVAAEGRPKSATTYLGLPGVDFVSTGTTSVSTNRLYYAPFYVATPITIDLICCEVTGNAAAGNLARLGIYRADTDWQPTTLVVDAGTVSAGTIGFKSIAANVTLSPGRYLTAFINNASPVFRVVRGGNRYAGLNSAIGSNPLIVYLFKNTTFASFPETGTPWDTISYGTVPFQHFVFLRISSFN
jgi:hypothetical protein